MRDKIREIRIEGHTDDTPAPGYDTDPYLANVILSQKRALSVLRFIRDLPEYKRYSEEEQRLLEYWFTANGLSYGRALDVDGKFALISGNPISKEHSRRVEIRIVTSGDEVLENFVIQNNRITN
jgi:outer membrane protein OmpA-like peptidoglycan-associated protein